ncbi:hypothetical protein [Micromonospora auratinigra]|uniref:Peptidase inhibitor family I36 n=1 Tax=Micromonospora auratinigra TaxID=261654 RepID=A0A1A9A3Q7_9ACTN|nr:hypothetical protein [Micromonospora auratinigra]SBT51084.1 hypothetical protein GA0070611_5014 [Micromonospora auratinigra]
MKVRSLVRMSVAALTLAGALTATAAPATAARSESVQSVATATTALDVQLFKPASCSTSWTFRDMWGYVGTFKCGSSVMQVDWSGSGRYEYFGVAPDRSIWHSWSSSHGFVRMPNGGRADTAHWASATSSGARTVSVHVSGSGYWCATDYAGDSASWNAWRRC